jgi:PAS domain S-box-containing protein
LIPLTEDTLILSGDAGALREIINNIPSALLIVGSDGKVLSCNRKALTLFCGTAEDIVGSEIGAFFRIDGKNPGVHEYIRRSISEKSVTGTVDCIRCNRDPFTARVTFHPFVYQEMPSVMISLIEEERTDEFSSFISHCPYAIMTLNPDLSVRDVNTAFTQISGYSHEESIQMNLQDFRSHSRDGQTVDDAIQARRPAGGRIVSIFPSGIRHLEYLYIPIYDQKGNLSTIYDVFCDQTRFVEQLNESHSLINGNPASILTLDPSGGILSVNPSFIEVSHMSEETLLSMKISDLSVLQREGVSLQEAVSSGKNAKGRLVLDFGWAVRTLDYTYIPVTDLNGQVIRLVAMYVDVTDQVAYIDEIKTFIRENPSAVATYNPDLSITDLNRSFLDISGYTEEEGRHLKMTDFKVLKREGETISDAIRTGMQTKGKIIIEFPSGIKYIDYFYIPITGVKGEVTRIYQIFSDFTSLEEKIGESEALISENPACIMTLGLDGKILSVNPAFTALSRIPRETLLTMRIQDFTILEREGGSFAEFLNGKKTTKGRVVVDFGWGIRILDFTYIPILDVNGLLTKIVTMYVDVTEQVNYITEVENVIRENPNAIITLNPDLNIIDINPAFSTMIGYSAEESRKLKLTDLKVVRRDGQTVGDAIRTRKAAGGTAIIDTPNGILHISYVYIPIFDRKGDATKIFEVISDLTGLVDQIRESEMMVAGNPAGVVTVDLKGAILSINKAFTEICQMPESRLLTMKIQDFSIIAREGAVFSEVISSREPGTGTLTVDFGNMTKIVDYTYIPILDVNGIVTKVVIVYMDVTAIKKLVQYLESSVGLVQHNISQLAAGDTSFTTTVLEADEYTRSARELFVRIDEAVETARKAISRLVDDSSAIATAAIAGDLKFRSDPSGHSGDYQKIIEGMNQTLDSITTPVNESMSIATRYAAYDFTARFDSSLSVKGDWIAFSQSLDEIGDRVGEAIGKINAEMANLSANAEEAHASAQEIADGATLMAKNAGTVSMNAEEGSQGIRQILKAMEDLTVTVGAVSKKTEEVSVATQNANALARKGSDMAKRAEEGMNVITTSTDDMNRLIREIQKEMDQIGKIVVLIKDIANQTNLLALNAAIEAARAGEAGRGFAVVAAEVKSLAQESRSSAENIAEMIGSLQIKSADAGRSADITADAVSGGSVALSETLTIFGELAGSVEGISANVEQVASMSEEQAASAEEIAASVQEVSGLFEGTTAEAAEMVKITEASASSLDQLKSIIQNVNSVTGSVSGAVTQFRV